MKGAVMFALGAIFGAMLALYVQASQPEVPTEDAAEEAEVLLT